MLYLLHATALMQLYNPFVGFVFFLPFVFLINVNCCQNFCGNGKTSAKGDFLYFLDNDMDLWVEFWKFVSKCFQVFTWPYVYIYL